MAIGAATTVAGVVSSNLGLVLVGTNVLSGAVTGESYAHLITSGVASALGASRETADLWGIAGDFAFNTAAGGLASFETEGSAYLSEPSSMYRSRKRRRINLSVPDNHTILG